MKVLHFFTLAIASCASLEPVNAFGVLQSQDYKKGGGSVKTFESLSHFIDSAFLKELEKKKNPTLAAKTVIRIKKDENGTDPEHYFLFDESEKNYEGNDSIWRYIRTRKVKFREISFGQFVRITSDSLPLSNCASSKLSSSGTALQLKTGWSRQLSLDSGLSHTHTSGFNTQVPIEVALTASMGYHPFSFSYGSSSSITCGAKPGETVQVLGSMNFASFPNAKQRQADFSRSVGEMAFGAWSPVVTKKKYRALGMLMFDDSEFQTSFCSTNPNLLDCSYNFEQDDPLSDTGFLEQLDSKLKVSVNGTSTLS